MLCAVHFRELKFTALRRVSLRDQDLTSEQASWCRLREDSANPIASLWAEYGGAIASRSDGPRPEISIPAFIHHTDFIRNLTQILSATEENPG